ISWRFPSSNYISRCCNRNSKARSGHLPVVFALSTRCQGGIRQIRLHLSSAAACLLIDIQHFPGLPWALCAVFPEMVPRKTVFLRSRSPELAHSDASRHCSTLVAFGAKRTLTEPRLQRADL